MRLPSFRSNAAGRGEPLGASWGGVPPGGGQGGIQDAGRRRLGLAGASFDAAPPRPPCGPCEARRAPCWPGSGAATSWLLMGARAWRAGSCTDPLSCRRARGGRAHRARAAISPRAEPRRCYGTAGTPAGTGEKVISAYSTLLSYDTLLPLLPFLYF